MIRNLLIDLFAKLVFWLRRRKFVMRLARAVQARDLAAQIPTARSWGQEVVAGDFAKVPAATDQPKDALLAGRIVASYAYGVRLAERDVPGIWREIFNQRLGLADQILGSGNAAAAAELLRKPAASNLFWGIDDLVHEFHALLFSQPEAMAKFRVLCYETLLRLAEALGSVRVLNPETGPHSPPRVVPDDVLAACDAVFGVRVELPNVFVDETGFRTSRGVLSYRMLHALYVGIRLRSLLGDLHGKRILEIGAGVGRTAYVGVTLGAETYDVVDIPITGAIQSYFLGRALGEDAVRLQGEAAREGARPKVRLLAPDEFLGGSERYDLIVNVDSLTEIPLVHARKYAGIIPLRCPVFVSINHEANSFTVGDLFTGHAHTRLRHPYWLRPGYTEEIYRWTV